MTDKKRQPVVGVFAKSLETNRVEIQQRREAVQQRSGRAVSENRAKWLRSAVTQQSRQRAAM